MTELQYKNRLRTQKYVACTFKDCNEAVQAKHYQRHLLGEHHITVRQKCVWCLNYTWRKKDKTVNNFAHRLPCLMQRISADAAAVEEIRFGRPIDRGEDTDEETENHNPNTNGHNRNENVHNSHNSFLGSGSANVNVHTEEDNSFNEINDELDICTILLNEIAGNSSLTENASRTLEGSVEQSLLDRDVNEDNIFDGLGMNSEFLDPNSENMNPNSENINPNSNQANKRKSTSNRADPKKRSCLDLYLNCRECADWLKYMSTREPYVPSPDLPLNFGAEIEFKIDHFRDLAFADMPAPDTLKQIYKFWVKDNTLEFDDESGLDVKWFKFFYCSQNTLRWFHLSVRHQVWDKFFEIANDNNEIFGVLPYWCLCNAGDVNNKTLWHRHVVVCVDKNRLSTFKKLLAQLQVDRVTERGKKLYAKYHKQITSMKQFINTINYVGKEQSMCCEQTVLVDGVNQSRNESTFHGLKVWHKPKKANRGRSHFYIAKPVLPHSTLILGGVYPEGFQDITEILYMTKSALLFAEKTDSSDYTVKFKYLHEMTDHIIPLRSNLLHDKDNTETPMYYFVNGEKIYLKEVAEYSGCSRRQWNRQHAQAGLHLINVARNGLYRLNKQQKAVLSELSDMRNCMENTHKLQLKTKDDQIKAFAKLIKSFEEKMLVKDQQIEAKDQQLKAKDEQIVDLLNKLYEQFRAQDAQIKMYEGQVQQLMDLVTKGPMSNQTLVTQAVMAIQKTCA